MKKVILLVFIVLSYALNAQTIDYNTKKGFAVEGYDVVSYFSNTPKKGTSKYMTTCDGIKYKFSSQENLDLFHKDPKKYLPEYGGYCAYAIGMKGKKVSVDPKTFEIREGKLYLFYNSWGNNTLKSWLDESPNELKIKADKNWERVKVN